MSAREPPEFGQTGRPRVSAARRRARRNEPERPVRGPYPPPAVAPGTSVRHEPSLTSADLPDDARRTTPRRRPPRPPHPVPAHHRAPPAPGGSPATPSETRPRRPRVPGPLRATALCALPLTAALLAAHGWATLGPERAAHTRAVAHRPDAVATAALVITATGSGPVPYALVLLSGALAGRTTRERLHAAATALTVFLLGQAVRYGMMELITRPRPSEADWTPAPPATPSPPGTPRRPSWRPASSRGWC